MKTKLLFLVVLIAAVVFSCQKKDSEPAQQDVVFSVVQVDQGLKSTNDTIPCDPNLVPVYAHVKIKDAANVIKDYYPLVFRLDGKLYSQAIKLAPGTYTVTQFLVMDDLGDGQGANDKVYMATPEAGSTFAEYVTPTVPFNFTVDAFTKIEIDVEVLCFLEKYYTDFGFFWFNITEIIIREQCFFGDICLKHWIEYAGSNYELQPGDLGLDMVAIVEIMVYKNGAFVETFTNNTAAQNYGVGAPVCVTYADELGVVDTFTFELYILVKQGNQFVFVKFKTWTFTDAQMIEAGQDGVVDFVLGTCNFTDTDLQLPPWQNLPDQANVSIAYPGNLPSYWDIKFNTYTPAGLYDLPAAPTGWMDGWCGDENTTIVPGTFNAYIYGSIYVADWPAGMPFTELQINRVNWLINHLGDYNLDFENLPQGDADNVQKAVWNLLSGAAYGGVAGTMSADAIAAVPDINNLWYPLPGGWGAVIIVKNNQPLEYQVVFVIVDP
jgi:hypothetical protein